MQCYSGAYIKLEGPASSDASISNAQHNQIDEPEPDTCAFSYTVTTASELMSYYLELSADRTHITTFQYGTSNELPIHENPDVVVLDPRPKTCLQAFERLLKMGAHIGQHRGKHTLTMCSAGRVISPEVAVARIEQIREAHYNAHYKLYDMSSYQGICAMIEDLYAEINEVLSGERSVIRAVRLNIRK
ncbi:hypothetical protein Pmar_PMAR007474 [Perkinsus marinus ATCC 50983]|uniref:Uncharacterized protein n=1 Tax=Perkinsus marinus (strain ATCC 50983 / TXsc) TaxID=423536 RepID=C5M047_PERM5|nr:hypothetical protein Pmar_PMAR007474 [Perkinsus marinus ATCC 50983]EEQ97625.1 hypothetical protein Pmar_PMAR007474 [Perkinsus marinus ATCC 50983]|eukprot:XP_002764908.1 hypothetical protein Pmar_PMAR007474 [Perkinsus marinus ATCC 50983]